VCAAYGPRLPVDATVLDGAAGSTLVVLRLVAGAGAAVVV
jgi:hypothetical protein